MVVGKVRDGYGFYLCSSCCVVLTLQFLIGILINFGFLPVTDIYLPFVSYGGMSYIVNMVCVGIILCVWRRNNIIPTISKVFEENTQNLIKIEDGKIIITFKKSIL